MKNRLSLQLTIISRFTRLAVCCLLAAGSFVAAQDSPSAITVGGPGGTNTVFFSSAGGMQRTSCIMISAAGFGSNGVVMAGVSINGKDIGSALLETLDLNHDGKVTLGELIQVADACFKLWDTNSDGYLSQGELSTGLSQFFPAPPVGGGMAVINGTAVSISPDDMPTPGKQVTKHIMATADTNKDGFLSLQELNDYLTKSFPQWDQNGDGSLDTQELGMAFGQLAVPD